MGEERGLCVIGQRLEKIETSLLGDKGIKLTFADGSTLEFVGSGDECTIWRDGNELDDMDIKELAGESE